MNYRYCANGESPERASFDVYLHDKHAADDRIVAFNLEQSRDALLQLRQLAPHAVAKMLAVEYPWSADQADEVETVLQDSLPFSE